MQMNWKFMRKLKTAIKQDLSPDLKPLDYAIWSVFEYETNTTSYPNIGSLKTAIEEEWKKMSERFILKARKSFRCRNWKNDDHIE